ncbi:TetR/AcrR family transcriptional regulator [Cytobacillus kochii]|uniref:TetR/AcrR family transcriptional regulator n=1 Tax=Cytobacillus kochii TaxID=859143 RepID=UPI002E224C86|nr:TetR/AcrR family transcriptional regulator [Cytobacillus kochii]
MNKKLDRRKQYTRMVLKESLMELLREKIISSITIKELCQKADINRSTFYSHYRDQFDLLQHIEDEILLELQVTLRQYNHNETNETFAMTKYLLDYVYKRSSDFLVLFSDHGNKAFQTRVIDTAQSIIINSLKEDPQVINLDKSKYMIYFVISGCIYVIEKWLMNGMKESPEEMTTIITEISNRVIVHSK